jgi:hypothetical protein
MKNLDFYRLELKNSIRTIVGTAKLLKFFKEHNFTDVTPIWRKVSLRHSQITAVCFQEKSEAMRFKLIWTTTNEELK